MKILVAEDDALSRTILKKAVEKFGHEVSIAEDGEKAWELFQSTEEELDVVIRCRPYLSSFRSGVPSKRMTRQRRRKAVPSLCRVIPAAAEDDVIQVFTLEGHTT